MGRCLGVVLFLDGVCLWAAALACVVAPQLFWSLLLVDPTPYPLPSIAIHISCVLGIFVCTVGTLALFSAFYTPSLILPRMISIMVCIVCLLIALLDGLKVDDDAYANFGLLCHAGVTFGIVLCNSMALMHSFYTETQAEQPKPTRNASGALPYSYDKLSKEDIKKFDSLEGLPPMEGGKILGDKEVVNDDEGRADKEDVLNKPDSKKTTPGEEGEGGDGEEEEIKPAGFCRLLQLASEQKMFLFGGCVALLIRLPFSLAVPHFVSEVLGALFEGDKEAVWHNILLLAMAGTVDAVLDFWNYFLFGYAQQRLIRNLRVDLFAAILRQEIGFFDVTSTGELSSRISNDTSEMANDLTWVFRFSIEAVVRIGGIMTYMFIREWRLALLSCGIIPICAVSNKLYGDWLQRNSIRVQSALADANASAQEGISCVRTVYTFANEDQEVKGYLKKVLLHYRLNVKQVFMQAMYYMVVSTFLINTVVQASILSYGGYLILYRPDLGKSPRTMIAFMLYQGQLQEYCSNLFNSFTNLIKSSGAGAKVFQLLDRTPKRPLPAPIQVDDLNSNEGVGTLATLRSDAEGAREAIGNISVENVHFSYPSRPSHAVLAGVSFKVNQGECVALVGASGNGKSTLFHLIENFYQPSTGCIKLDDEHIHNWQHRRLHMAVGIVSQEPVLMSGSILRNIAYSQCDWTKISQEERAELLPRVERAAIVANAHEFITALPLGYNTEVGERGVQLSGGQKQRIAIARAMLQNPAVLLLDEATSALDSESERLVQGALEQAMKGRTTLVISHRLSTIRKADRIVVLDKGAVVEVGNHKDLMDKPLQSGPSYRAMVEREAAGFLS